MKTPFSFNEPLLRNLTEEAADLPLKAAAEARRARADRIRQRRQIALAIVVLFCGVCAWRTHSPRDTGREFLTIHEPPDAALSSAQPNLRVIVRTEEQARKEPLPWTEGLTADQASVVNVAHGLPLLLIRDRSGRVARIHAIER